MESEEVKAKAGVALGCCNGACSQHTFHEVALHWSPAALTPCAAPPAVCSRASMDLDVDGMNERAEGAGVATNM